MTSKIFTMMKTQLRLDMEVRLNFRYIPGSLQPSTFSSRPNQISSKGPKLPSNLYVQRLNCKTLLATVAVFSFPGGGEANYKRPETTLRLGGGQSN